MRIDTKEIPGLRDLTLDSADSVSFNSALPSAEAIRLAWGNPDLESIISEAGLGEAMTKNAGRANRWVQGIAATKLGVPSEVMPAFEQAVWKIGASSWKKFATGLADSSMDLGLDAMGCVPVIGVAAKFAVVLVQRLVQMSRNKQPVPQSMRYVKDIDVDMAREALEKLYSNRARDVFAPPATNVRAWRVTKREKGFAVDWDGDALGMGVIPGTNAVVGSLGSDIHWTRENYMACNASGRACSDPSGIITTSQRASVRRDWDRVFRDTIGSSGEHFPSLRRVGSAMWSGLTSTRTAAVYDFDTRGLITAWDKWADAADSMARDAMNGGVKKMYLDRYVGFQALQRSARMPFYGLDAPDVSIATFAGERIREVQQLQMELLDTLAVAYCSETQPAFKSKALGDKLTARRKQLLSHPARWEVSKADIVDKSYRAEFEAATADNERPLAALPTDGFDASPRRASPLAGPSADGGGGAGLLLLAAGAFAATLF
ncbi:MAG: hypothetical protein MJE66_15305 [Proteobacteria bacterium]|nr:hypothetical protein [Pseudomonadota bacterium]